MQKSLQTRSNSKCELCQSDSGLSVFDVTPNSGLSAATSIYACAACAGRLANLSAASEDDWRCLADSMWSEHTPVQVLAYRVLKSLPGSSWAQGLLGQLYLDEETLKWADAGLASPSGAEDSEAPTLDSNGVRLSAGDSVTLIKDLDVKGMNFTAKRGTIVKNINLAGDPKFVEGKVNGTTIVLVAAYLKKA